MARSRKAKPAKRSTKKASGAKKTSAGKRTAGAKKKPRRRASSSRAASKDATAKLLMKPADEGTSKPGSTEGKKSPASETLSRKRSPSQKKTTPGGSAPVVDDVTKARGALRELREIVERVSDADAELILGDGNLETLLASVVPLPTRTTKSLYDHLGKHKRRASLLARLRHGINDRSAFVVDGRHVSPTRVQWFYDGLTFLEGDEPYRGVVGLHRDGVVSYALGVDDADKGDSLGPLASDFVSVDEAKKSFRAASGRASDALARMHELASSDVDETPAWVTFLTAQPWALGAQHTAISRLERRDADLPEVVAKRVSDGAHDVLLIEPPTTEIVGKTGKVLTSFRDVWARAEHLRTFVQRQAGYLQRELKLKIRDPRFLIIAGRGLSPEERSVVTKEMEAHHAAVRLITYDELRLLAERTAAFFGPRI
jgi:hypothetical protein